MKQAERPGWIRVPDIEPLDIRTCWEHMPLDYHRYGEYPRFLSSPHSPRLPWHWERAALALGERQQEGK